MFHLIREMYLSLKNILIAANVLHVYLLYPFKNAVNRNVPNVVPI